MDISHVYVYHVEGYRPGGTQRCGQPVFASTADPDYQKVLRSFDPVKALLRERPRADMPESAAVCLEQVSQP